MTAPPARIHKYELIRRLGHGGMGTVYLARDPDLDRRVAIKLLRDPLFDEELLHRFLREARSAANLRHENIVTVYDIGQHEHQPYMAMEYVDGRSLSEIIAAREPLPLGEKLGYIEQLCAGLHYAHTEGIVHRDIKPANVMVDRRGVVRIVDFGIARVEGSDMTRVGDLIGTISYMSPEQMAGRPVDYRSDIFAVGAVAYELLAYQQAFGGTLEGGAPRRRLHEEVPHLSELCPGLPNEIEQVVMKAVAKEPEDRVADLEQFRAAIRDVRRTLDPGLQLDPIRQAAHQATIVIPRSKTTPPPKPEPVSDRRRFAFAAAGTAVVIGAAIVGTMLWILGGDGRREADPPAAAPPVASSPAKPEPTAPPSSAAPEPAPSEPAVAPASTTALDDNLARINVAYVNGNLEEAVRLVQPLLASNPDDRVRDVARRIAQTAQQSMGTAESSARKQGGVDLTSGAFAAGTRSKRLAERASANDDHVEAARQALAATNSFKRAERDAIESAAATPAPAPTTPIERPAPQVATRNEPSPGVTPATNPPPAATAPIEKAASPEPTPAPPPAATRPSPLEAERPGILSALTKYQNAYRERSVDALKAVFPSLPREAGQRLDRTFRNCRDYDVSFSNPQLLLNADDPTSATVTVRTVYTCQPKTKQPAEGQAVQDVFLLRKLAGAWLIENLGSLDGARRQ